MHSWNWYDWSLAVTALIELRSMGEISPRKTAVEGSLPIDWISLLNSSTRLTLC